MITSLDIAIPRDGSVLNSHDMLLPQKLARRCSKSSGFVCLYETAFLAFSSGRSTGCPFYMSAILFPLLFLLKLLSA